MTQQLFMKIRPSVYLKHILPVLLSLFIGSNALKAQKTENELNVIQSWIHFSDAPNSLYHHLAGEAFNFLDKRANNIAALHSLSDWEKRQELVRKTLLDIVGPFPAKTSLNAKTVATIVKDGYKMENIIYESQPGFYVTSSLFIPDGLKGKAPVIIYCSGHSDIGYRN